MTEQYCAWHTHDAQLFSICKLVTGQLLQPGDHEPDQSSYEGSRRSFGQGHHHSSLASEHED